MEANVNVADIFLQHFVRNCSQFVILWQLRTHDWFVNKALGTWYRPTLCPFIGKSGSSGVGEFAPELMDGGFESAETILPFQYHVEWILFLRRKLLILYPYILMTVSFQHKSYVMIGAYNNVMTWYHYQSCNSSISVNHKHFTIPNQIISHNIHEIGLIILQGCALTFILSIISV